jgi:restriction endonuclease S subunit
MVINAARTLVSKRLADSYESKPLGSIAHFMNGTSYDTGLVADVGLPIIRIANMTDHRSHYIRTRQSFDSRFSVSQGDLLVSWSASFKSVIWTGPNGILNQHIFKVVEKNGDSRSYIRHMIEAAFDDMRRNVVGIGMMHLRRADFLGHKVPCPPHPVQVQVARYLDSLERGIPGEYPDLPEILTREKRVLAKIDAIAARLAEAGRLRQEIQDDAKALLHSVFHRLIQDAPSRPLAEVAPIVRRPVQIESDGAYPELGVRSFGRGIFHKQTLIGADLDWQKLFRVQAGDLVISNIKAWEGAIAVAGAADHGRVGSHRYITCVANEGVATPEFVCFYLLTSEGIEQVQTASPGSADRNRTLAMSRLERIRVPVPPMDKQREFSAMQAKVAAIHQAQAANQAELDALLPAVLDKAFKGEL